MIDMAALVPAFVQTLKGIEGRVDRVLKVARIPIYDKAGKKVVGYRHTVTFTTALRDGG